MPVTGSTCLLQSCHRTCLVPFVIFAGTLRQPFKSGEHNHMCWPACMSLVPALAGSHERLRAITARVWPVQPTCSASGGRPTALHQKLSLLGSMPTFRRRAVRSRWGSRSLLSPRLLLLPFPWSSGRFSSRHSRCGRDFLARYAVALMLGAVAWQSPVARQCGAGQSE